MSLQLSQWDHCCCCMVSLSGDLTNISQQAHQLLAYRFVDQDWSSHTNICGNLLVINIAWRNPSEIFCRRYNTVALSSTGLWYGFVYNGEPAKKIFMIIPIFTYFSSPEAILFLFYGLQIRRLYFKQIEIKIKSYFLGFFNCRQAKNGRKLSLFIAI